MRSDLFDWVRPARTVRWSRRRSWVAALAGAVLVAVPSVAVAGSLTAAQAPAQALRITGVGRDTVAGTRGLSDRFSIPRPGQANTLQRRFTVDYVKPPDVTITNVRVGLLNYVNGVLLQTVTNAAPGGAGVSVVDADTLRVRVTFGDGVTSTINSTPPPTNRIRYRFILTGRDGNNRQVTATLDSVAYFPLWRMPDGLPRYGVRDAGGDDWSSQFTYNWLANPANRALVTRINDISGEHARNLNHATHYEGTDIDLFHAYTFPGVNPALAGAGDANYEALVRDTQLALGGDAAARQRVAAWATQTRARFNQLLAHPDVHGTIYYAIGTARPETRDPQGQLLTPRLDEGWARTLLRNGVYSNTAGQRVDLGIGVWQHAANGRMAYNRDHNNHFHISLRDPNAVQALRITRFSRDGVASGAGLRDRFSIPRAGQANTMQRRFTLDYVGPPDVTITNVRVSLLNHVTGAVLQTVTNAAPGGAGVSVVDADTLLVRATFGDGVTSTINSTPPPTDRIRYLVTLSGRDGNNRQVTAVRNSAAYFPLWRMPDGLSRYGIRDAGGDDWSSQFTYNWLANPANRALVTRINDISGEHGRNIGHAGHLQEGRDIDLFDVYAFPGVNPAAANAADANYAALVRDTQLAVNGDAGARQRVVTWATRARARFDQLLAHPDVQGTIYYTLGTEQPEVRDPQGQIITPRLGLGWARALLTTGAYRNAAGQGVDLGIGAWQHAANPRMSYLTSHNGYFHTRLRA